MRNWDPLLSESDTDIPTTTSLAYTAADSLRKSPNLSPCGWQRDWEAVQQVCKHVGIPKDRVRLVDLSKEYWAKVFEPAISIWEGGGTPNPDVACNREIKFGSLLEHIPKDERHFLATGASIIPSTMLIAGHYARLERTGSSTKLYRAADDLKDQSYYLSSVTEAQLSRVSSLVPAVFIA